jgi:hypothetical protein
MVNCSFIVDCCGLEFVTYNGHRGTLHHIPSHMLA